MIAGEPMLIRADCSASMGTGHVMRCLALAQAAQDEGQRVAYAMADCSAGVSERLRDENIAIVHLDCDAGTLHDAHATAEAARSCGSNWVVLDGYHFDTAYHAAIKDFGLSLLAMDDFGKLDRYVADIVVNQDPIADEELYRCRKAYTRLLLGTEFTFLRREFRRLPRPQLRAPALPRRLLLTFGGSDPGCFTELALEAIESVNVDGLETIIFVGPGNPRWEQLEAAAKGRADSHLLRDPSDIPGWMAGSDLAVISAGSTLWELAYCRVPCIVVAVAGDQTPAIDRLVERGACLSLGSGKSLAAKAMAEVIVALCTDRERRAALAANLAAMVDGLGAQRVLAAMQTVGAACR